MKRPNVVDNHLNFSGWNKSMNRNFTFCFIVTLLFATLSDAAKLPVPSFRYPTIQAAIKAAYDGDTIEIDRGPYLGTGFTVKGKNLIITGKYPNDPNQTVIDCAGRSDGGFFIYGKRDSSGDNYVGFCELRGLTIANTYTHYGDGTDGTDPGEQGYPGGWNIGGGAAIFLDGNHKVTNCIIRNASIQGGEGGNGSNGDANNLTKVGGKGGDGGPAGGAGITIIGGSPIIRNIIIEDCNALGGNGGNGGDGNNDEANSVNSGIGGNGGVAGEALGAGICVYGKYYRNLYNFLGFSLLTDAELYALFGVKDGPLPTPTFENCIVRNCRATGGTGGNGGDGGFGAWRDEGGSGGGYGGLTYYDPQQDAPIDHSAMGGGIYISSGCSATFTNCTISNSSTDGSTSGIGGQDWGGYRQQPQQITPIESFGGGIYCGENTDITLSGCGIQDNNTTFHEDYYSGYGGGLAIFGAFHLEMDDCNISGNISTVGGGFYGGWIGSFGITDSNILDNFSYIGGGLYINDTSAEVLNNVISGNSAKFPSNSFNGSGGGIYSSTSDALISNCTITKNTTNGSGGGIYIDSDLGTSLFNSLIAGNTAYDDGGGISANWSSTVSVNNCTVADNIVSGRNGSGGGLFAAYSTNIVAKDTILWNNSGINGSQIGLSRGGSFINMPATLDISYSDVDLEYSSGINWANFGIDSDTTTLAPKLIDSTTINSEINAGGTAKVIVTLKGASESINWSSPQEVSNLRAEVASLQNQVLATLGTSEFTLRQKLTNTAIFSGQVNGTGLSKLMANSKVAHIEPVRTVRPMLAQAIPLANALNTRPIYNGSGISIAIVDSGVDYTHPRLGGGGFPNSKVIGGYDTGDVDNDPMPASEAHGTACAGIAAGGLGTVGDYIGGVAYNAKIYALKITTDTGTWPTDSTLAAWDWCLTHKDDNPANPILVISNSWGTLTDFFDNSADADAYSPAHTQTAQKAVSAGITILAASGNEYQTDRIIWPAAMSNVISVGAVYDTTDLVTDYSNAADILDILAPADPIYTTDIVGAGGYTNGDYYPSFNGTSSACPFAAGSVAALQSAAKQTTGQYLTSAQVKSILVTSGKQITDTKVLITKPRIDLGEAIAMLTVESVPVYTETGCTIDGLEQDVDDIWAISTGSNNIAEDPNFVLGYYLGRKDTGQEADSPCIDAGDITAAAAGLENYTTSLDGVLDVADSDVDMGYHYKTGVPKYDITVQILEDANYPGIHGTISADSNGKSLSHPDSATYNYIYYAGMTPTFTATPNDVNFVLDGWYDANNILLSSSNSYKLTIDSDETIFVKFRKVVVIVYQPRTLNVPSDYQSLQYAIDDAKDGDRIILTAGTYRWNDTNLDRTLIVIDGKNITIASTNPDDPCVVAGTVILSNGLRIIDVNNAMTLDGITIQGAHYYNGNPDCTVNGPTGDGQNGHSIFGGAVGLTSASPTIRNCRFIDCSALGTNGCPGTGNAGDGGWAGAAYGGAFGIDSTSNPIFKNCDFINCYAQGGNGGDGAANGHGGNWGDPNDQVWHTWDWAPAGGYQDYWYYSGRGGAIYVMDGGKAHFEDCLFQNNRASSGYSGLSGIDGWPNYRYAIDAYGGAVYLAAGSEVNFVNCDFIGNEANTRNQLNDANGYDGAVVIYSPVISFGGGIYAEGSAVPRITNCQFTDNRACAGGGMYWENSTAYISQSKFENCTSMFGGAMAIVDSNSIIFDCTFNKNIAVNPGGQGGGIYSASSAVKFLDCKFDENIAKMSGGGAYFAGSLEPNMHNCLIVNNNADRDGGGISANWGALLGLSNCTIVNNSITGDGFASGFGGGVSVAYEAYVKIINSIIWNNNSEYGKALSIGSTFESVDKYKAEVSVSYSDLEGGSTGVFVDTASGCQLHWGSGNLSGTTLTSPLFITGYWGDFYLRQLTGQSAPISPCVDNGEGLAADHDLFRHTTRTDHSELFGLAIDNGSTDMGYHYLLYADLQGDFNYDGEVSRPDLALFMEYWLDDGCTFPYFCHDRDLTKDGNVDFEDFAIFALNYGETETTPPFPNPMTWKKVPDSYGDTVIAMKATIAKDYSGSPVMYNFVRYGSVVGDDRDFGWQTEPNLTDSGLVYKRKYGYQVRAKDARGNTTAFSAIKYAYPGEHLLPPTPDPMTWANVPTVISTNQITMTATTATDDAYGVEYFFVETSGNPGGSSSGWQASPIYTDGGLDANTTYTYQVRARDLSPNYNQTGLSIALSATTPAVGGPNTPVEDHAPPTAADGTPLTPGSMWATTPYIDYDGSVYYYHVMSAVPAIDANSPPVLYYFDCTSGNSIDSGWITAIPNTSGTIMNGSTQVGSWSVDSSGLVTFTAGGFTGHNHNTYRVLIKDSAAPPNQIISTKWNTLYGLMP